MALAFAYSAEQGLCRAEDAVRVAAHLRAAGLPDGLAAAGITAAGDTLVGHMLHDKKREGGTLPSCSPAASARPISTVRSISVPSRPFSTGNPADAAGVAKRDLPSKMCPVCQRPFAWRRKWARDWDNVVYCSDRCRRTGRPD